MHTSVGPYRVEAVIGRGGMGVVYRAHDPRLDRRIALKMLPAGAATEDARQRLLREARAAASVTHPNICQVYDVGEEHGEVYVAMELLDGESLATRLERGPLTVGDAGDVALSVLSALACLHRAGLVHRDVKPSNVFLTQHGVKLVDFGLARPVTTIDAATVELDGAVTQPGVLIGTPFYMSPEQVTGSPVDARADLFAVGVVLYEMTTGRRPFTGRTAPEVWGAVLRDPVPIIGGSAAAAALDRVVQRALARDAARRYPEAGEMARDLRAALDGSDGREIAQTPPTRIVVLPFRLLRPDADIDFLSLSLADALTATIASFDTLLVRSPSTASRYVTTSPDLASIGEALAVDVVVLGTLLRAGDRLRVAAQLVDVKDGTVLWSDSRQMGLDDLFAAEEAVARGIAESLSIPLAAREQRLLHADVPASPRAFECYLRGTRLAYDTRTWRQAFEEFGQCVALDPRYAPAWARLGRLQRVIAKYGETDTAAAMAWLGAEASLAKAIELNPGLSAAHVQVAALELDSGQPERALERLLNRAVLRPRDPDLYAGLVQACRYCGLLDASLEAHRVARRLDPRIQTSVLHTYWMVGQYAQALDERETATDPIRSLVLALCGREREAIAMLAQEESRYVHAKMVLFLRATRAVLEQDHAVFDRTVRDLMGPILDGAAAVRDAESVFYIGRLTARRGDADLAARLVSAAVSGGYACAPILERDPWLASLQGRSDVALVLDAARARSSRAAALFVEHGGERLLGVGQVQA